MKTYVYPAVLQQGKDGLFYLSLPDLGVIAVGDDEKQAFLNGKDCIKNYFDLAERFNSIIPSPSSFQEVSSKYEKKKNHKVVMIDVAVKVNKPELTEEEKDYKNFMKMFFDEV